MYWQSPSALLVAKNAVPSEGEWAGFWGNDAIDRKLHDIAASGPDPRYFVYLDQSAEGVRHPYSHSIVLIKRNDLIFGKIFFP
jgi:hypothetical protein